MEQHIEELETTLEEYFPKGKSKERGAALVLYATAVSILKRIQKHDSLSDKKTLS